MVIFNGEESFFVLMFFFYNLVSLLVEKLVFVGVFVFDNDVDVKLLLLDDELEMRELIFCFFVELVGKEIFVVLLLIDVC